MGFHKYKFQFLFIALLLFTPSSFSQIIFKELPNYKIQSSDSVLFDLSRTRSIIPLNGSWIIFPADDAEQKFQVGVPSIFKGSGELIFQKKFTLSKNQINNNKMKIVFLGLNYTADISVNNSIIYRHSGGTFPFQLDLPKDILHSDKDNILSVRLFYKLDSENTIPVKQRFLYPQNFGGILKDVYIHLTPDISIYSTDISTGYNSTSKKGNINFSTRIENRELRNPNDSVTSSTKYSLKLNLISPDGSQNNLMSQTFELQKNKEKIIEQNIPVSSPSLWSPSNPQLYTLKIELYRDDILLDVANRQISFYSLQALPDSLVLNGDVLKLNGVTYVPAFNEYGNLISYRQMDNDIKMIKELGFNSVRFAKSVPHPYYLELCEKYGLLAFVEMPLGDIPGDLAHDPNFITRSQNYLTNFIKAYKKYSAVAAIGLGNSYLSEIDAHRAFLKNLAGIVKNNSNKLTYASFANLNIDSIDGLDLYGVEFFDEGFESSNPAFTELQNKLGKGRVFVSQATYVVNIGNTDGYVNEHSFEAQAKYFDGIIEYSQKNPLAGYFLNTMFDYRGDYASLVAGYSPQNLYQIGILGEDRSTSRLSYKVVYSKLHNTEKVTIPIGSKKDDAPMIFILYGIVLALFMGVLVNSGRKFREDSSRAFLRPYNFYADVRDQRIMSGYHSTLLALVIAAITALLTANLLFFFKSSVVLEKLLLSFGSTKLLKAASYLAWHPTLSLVYLTITFIAVIILLSIAVKIASFFVRNKVFFSSVYFTIVWSFLPFVLLIPVGIVLYRILNADVANFYIYWDCYYSWSGFFTV